LSLFRNTPFVSGAELSRLRQNKIRLERWAFSLAMSAKHEKRFDFLNVKRNHSVLSVFKRFASSSPLKSYVELRI
jgi:hypothetical protein